MFKSPRFWKERKWYHLLLIPFSWIWIGVGKWMSRRTICETVSVPVICVGNVVMGGAGKTPTVLALVQLLKKMGHTPHVLSRGYGAYIKDVVNVDPSKHTYLQVGDEPLLLARTAPTWAGPNRVLSAKTAIANGASVLVMDDGLQNATLTKTLSFLVVDTIQGFGNQLVFPAGPLREHVTEAALRAQAMVVIGHCKKHKEEINAIGLRQFSADISVEREHKNEVVVAFCGMGYPEKFRATLEECGYNIAEFVIFADHHPYTIPDMLSLIQLKKNKKATLITTTKDWLRLPQAYRVHVEVLPITLKFKDEAAMTQFLESHIGDGNS